MATTHFTGQAERYRLVTRSDFDGLVCAALLKQLGMLDDILFVHPKDMQDGKVELTDRDITTTSRTCRACISRSTTTTPSSSGSTRRPPTT
jgi:hypothetical protein